LPIDDICFTKQAYRLCHFGRWYYSQPPEIFSKLPGFETIDRHHRKLHQSAHSLAVKIGRGLKITLDDYENLIEKEWNFTKAVVEFKEELLKTLFEFDPLTDILNRQAFIRILRKEYARLFRTADSCCICMVDLDSFKAVNDTHGHRAGDRVLRLAARHFSRNLRPYDSICRYGGEEFLICLPNTTLGTAKAIMNRLRGGLASLKIDLDEGENVKITASFGIAKVAVDGSLEKDIARADEAMYAAKQAGRNRVVVHEEMTASSTPGADRP
jgi:diguanylate cyclase (GGDEF)-like protein